MPNVFLLEKAMALECLGVLVTPVMMIGRRGKLYLKKKIRGQKVDATNFPTLLILRFKCVTAIHLDSRPTPVSHGTCGDCHCPTPTCRLGLSDRRASQKLTQSGEDSLGLVRGLPYMEFTESLDFFTPSTVCPQNLYCLLANLLNF